MFGRAIWEGLDFRWDTVSRDLQMKHRVDKTAFPTGFEAVSRFDRSSLSVSRSLFRISLPLALLLASWQFSASARAQTAIISGSGSCRTSSSIDGITSASQEKQPSQDSNTFPDSMTDIDDSDGALDDLSADTSTRNYLDTPHFSVTDLDAVTLRTPGIIPIPLFPVHCCCCLHDHIRERAPPGPGIKL